MAAADDVRLPWTTPSSGADVLYSNPELACEQAARFAWGWCGRTLVEWKHEADAQLDDGQQAVRCCAVISGRQKNCLEMGKLAGALAT